MLDKLITYIVCLYKTLYQVLPVARTNRITTSHDKFVVILVRTTGSTWYKVLYHHTMYVMGMYLKNKKTSINYHSIVTRTVVTVNPSYKTISSSMKKWPYKRCEEREGQFSCILLSYKRCEERGGQFSCILLSQCIFWPVRQKRWTIIVHNWIYYLIVNFFLFIKYR